MKKIVYFLLTSCVILLAGCFESTQETTINEDGSGVLVNTTDMSTMVGMIKQFGGDEVKKMEGIVKDTSIALSSMADSIPGLTPAEKELVRNGTLYLNLNMKEEKFITRFNFPFKSVSDVNSLNKISLKLLNETMKRQMGDAPLAGGMGNMQDEDSPKQKLFDEYFDVEYSKGVISKKINKEKYATVEDDESMKTIQQMSGMGAPVTLNYIINLPRPAKKVEGKGIKLSEDKKKVTLNVTSEDFFDDPSKFEYRIEY